MVSKFCLALFKTNEPIGPVVSVESQSGFAFHCVITVIHNNKSFMLYFFHDDAKFALSNKRVDFFSPKFSEKANLILFVPALDTNVLFCILTIKIFII